jgi:hypothetical protein
MIKWIALDKRTLRDVTLIYFVSQAVPYAAAQMPHNLRSVNDDFPLIGHPAIHAPRQVGVFLPPYSQSHEPDLDDEGIASMIGRINSMSTSSTFSSSLDR